MLHTVVRTHLEAFLNAVAERTEGAGLPRFVEDEFREFLTCGVLAHGCARLRCEGCGLDRLLPFSCQGRGFCPSCGGRRMTERAAQVVDAVLPHVPMRQWVLSLPHWLRYVLAWDHGLCRLVLGVYVRALLGFQRGRARRLGVRDGRSGAVTAIQRFGGALNVNPHFHTLAPDGVFTIAASGAVQFHPLPAPTDEEVGRVLATIRARILRLLARRGLGPDAEEARPDPVVEESPALAGLGAASVQGRVALGPRAGARVLALGRDPDAAWVVSGGPGTRMSKASTSTRTWPSGETTVSGWSSCAGICSGRRSPRNACGSRRTAGWCWSSRARGGTARAIWSSSLWISWRGWRR